ncbi:uncharacterized protein LOC142525868 [Primulina tabacum]|uniref:uncharacterized protein LOC142525868 n=1 Tax=Primulina tabacum TaxID=48773 RepID=UPI003F5A8B88
MTGSKKHLTNYVEVRSGRLTYGGGAKGKIVGKGILNVDGLPKLHNVLHVEGLNSNLTSISQLCDDDLHVKFNKNNCEVFNDANICVMSSARSADNCYQLGEGDGCRSAKVSDLDLRHQKLGHVSFKTLKNLCKFDDVRGMPNLSSGNSYVCGPCQKGKQTRVAHMVLQHFGTTRCLELLHMDLMGLMDVESLGGYVLNDRDNLAKFDSKIDKCLFLGYSSNSSAYRVFNLRTRTTMESINFVFDDLADLPVKTSEDDVEELLDISEPLTRNGVESGVESSEATPRTTPPMNRTETVDNDNDDDEDVKKRKGGLLHNDWFNLHELRVLPDKFGNIIQDKARLVAQGYTQVEGVDFDEAFAPVARIESFRLFLDILCHMHIKLYQMDVKSAFLNGILNEEAYAPRAWFGRLADYLINLGFKRGKVDKTLFIQKLKHDILICQVYVDDIIFGSSSQKLVDNFVECMSSQFEMSVVRELNFFLGLQIKQLHDGIFLCQSKYAKNLIKKFSNDNSKHMKTYMRSSEKVSKYDVADGVDNTMYHSIIGSLLYLTSTHPDIMFSVCLCARYQANPKLSHLKAVKRILRYIVGTLELGLWYTQETNTNLVVEDTADVESDVVDTAENMDSFDYDVSHSVSTKFYTEATLAIWLLYVNREFIEKKNIDMETYGQQNLTA